MDSNAGILVGLVECAPSPSCRSSRRALQMLEENTAIPFNVNTQLKQQFSNVNAFERWLRNPKGPVTRSR
jgi:arsenate reductase-like glutaredoxin family protein